VETDMSNECERDEDLPPTRSRCWYALDLVLFGGFALAYVGFFAATSLMNYLDGLRGGPKSFGGAILCGLPVVVLLWLCALPMRMLTAWLTYIRSWRRLVLSCAVTLVALATWISVPFMQLWPPGCETFTHGFRHYMQANADLGAIRGWLNTLDPNLCTGEYIDLYTGNDLKSRWPDTIAWPAAITRFDPHYVQLMKTETRRPKVRLAWGGALGHWGVEIGPEDMPIPPTEPSRKMRHPNGDVYYEHGESRLPLAPGAYVWRRIE
jgi:hypothetical protein